MFHIVFLIVAVAVGPALLAAQDSANSIVVEVGGVEHTVSAADLAALPQDTVRAREHGGPEETFVGPTLAAILAHAGAKVEGLRGAALAQYVVIDARDHYRVVYAIAELSPEFTSRRTVLAHSVNGQPITAPVGPWRVVADGDLRPARWVRDVTAVRLRVPPP
jgi:hypothetical protein